MKQKYIYIVISKNNYSEWGEVEEYCILADNETEMWDIFAKDTDSQKKHYQQSNWKITKFFGVETEEPSGILLSAGPGE